MDGRDRLHDRFLLLLRTDRFCRSNPEEKEDCSGFAGPAAEEAERPAGPLYPPSKLTPDRPPTYFAAPADEQGFEFAKARARRQINAYHKWMADVAVEIEEMVPLVREGDARG